MLAVELAGSNDAILERMLGIETRDSVRNGHRGGDPGETGEENSRFGRDGSSAVGVVAGLDNGLLLLSDAFLSLPFPSTVFLSDPFLLRR
jgi:hypothetical protein